jgi:hypothetical protein
MKQSYILYDNDINLGGKPLVDVPYFPVSVIECNTKKEFIDAIRTSGFLVLSEVLKKLNYNWIGKHLTLNQLLEHWNVNYVDVYLDELKRIGWTKIKLENLILSTPTYDNTDFNKTVEVLFQSKKFCKEYKGVSWMFLSDTVIFKLFEIDFVPLLKRKKLLKYLG